MQTESFVDAVAAVVPVVSTTEDADARMYLSGTVRRRGTGYVIEQRLAVDTGIEPRWTTPRIHRVVATDATRDVLQAHIDQVVSIIGTPGGADTRNRTAIVLESVQPLD